MKIKTLLNYITNTDKKYSDIIEKVKQDDSLKLKINGLNYQIQEKDSNNTIILHFIDKNVNKGLLAISK